MNLSFYTKLRLRSLRISQAVTAHFFSSTAGDSLYRRISPLGAPNTSIVPVLDQWFREGNAVNREELQRIIKELRKYKRFNHALEISHWMTDKMYISLRPIDVADRMNLIFKVHGLEQVEKYFNDIAKQLRGTHVYTALLNCYANEKSVEKAEMIMQKMRDMAYAKSTTCYNILMNLYNQMGNSEKINALMLDMEKNGISGNQYTFSAQLTAYVAAFDIKGMDEIMKRVEANPEIALDWRFYSVAANGYLKVGNVEKTTTMLKKLEVKVPTKNPGFAFDVLLKLNGEIGRKDELYRIWNRYKKKGKIFNKGYVSMISSLLKLDDMEGAEKIFEEWETRKLSYNFRVPNLLIDTYCKKGLVEKAESLINHAIVSGGMPTVDAWYSLAKGYLEDNQIPNAMEAIKKAILVCPPGWKPGKETLVTCLNNLEGNGDAEEGILSLSKVEN